MFGPSHVVNIESIDLKFYWEWNFEIQSYYLIVRITFFIT